MRFLSVIVLLVALLACGFDARKSVSLVAPVQAKKCAQCHQDQYLAFSHTAMVRAASSKDFIRARESHKGRCLQCHAPSGGDGLVCRDCHGPGPHPYPRLRIPQVCARCHDAPGENTVRSYTRAADLGLKRNCLDCHGKSGDNVFRHDFPGPAVAPEWLKGSASLRGIVRTIDGILSAVLQIRHRAGHALPGGTTGRSVWLIVEGEDNGREPVWRQTVRFGWIHDPAGEWRDQTLPPGRPVSYQIERPDRQGTKYVTATLAYRFQPGPLDREDPRQVILDQIELAMP